MEDILLYINSHASYAPFIIFGLLCLAGLNIAVSEDIMIFTSAFLAIKNPDLLYPLFVAVFLGAYVSDLICYSLGRVFGPRLWRIRWFANMITPVRVQKIEDYLKKYGVITLFLGRFIPFGVRNGLFLTAGFSRMSFVKFALADFVAATISVSSFFALYYNYGESVIEYVKKGNLLIFTLAVCVVIFFFFKKKSTPLNT